MKCLWISVLSMITLFQLLASPASASLLCSKTYLASVSPTLQQEALTSLWGAIQKMPPMEGRPPHQLEIRNGQGVLHVGFLLNSEKRFSATLIRALKAGAIAEIDAGIVVGPKVLLLLSQLRGLSPSPVLVKGTLISEFVFPAVEDDIRGTKQWEKGLAPRPDFPWSEAEIQSLPQALRDLKIKEACRELWGTKDLKNCGRMKFQFYTTDNPAVHWTR